MKVLISSTNLSKRLAPAVCAALALMCGAAAIAAEAEEVRQVVVRFADLDLSKPQGAAALYNRIATAANEVCGAFDLDARELGSRAAVDACKRKAISGAVTRVGRPELFAIYNAKNAGPLGLPVAATRPR